MGLKASVVLLAGAAAANPTVSGPPREAPVVLLVDVSESVGRSGGAWPEGAGAAVERIAFADGVVSVARGEDPVGLPRERTRLAEALSVATETAAGAGGVVWLTTDGLDTEGGALAAARDLAAKGVRLFVSASTPPVADVGIESARFSGPDPAGRAVVVVRVASSVSGRVRVFLRRGAETVDQRDLEVAPSTSPVVSLADAAGVKDAPAAYEVSLLAAPGTPDDDPKNDRVVVPVPVGAPRVFVLDPERWPATLPGGVTILDAGGTASAEAEGADLLVVSNWRRMPDEGAERLARFVARGGRLLVLGGPDAFGPGGWRQTQFERLLPLRSRPKEGGGSDVVIALDRSGSTSERPASGGPPSLEALVDALTALLSTLPGDARVLVLPFSERPGEPLAPGWAAGSEPERRRAVVTSARALASEGGTDIDRAIVAAAEALRTRPPARRHVIVLTDGDPDHALDASSFAASKAALASAGATFHAVVRGHEKTVQALRSLAVSDEDVALIQNAGEFADALAKAFGRAEAGEEIVRRSHAVRAPEGSEAAAFARGGPVSAVHALVAAPDATVLATASSVGGGTALPFAASRAVGAGRVVAGAWGPALEPETARGAARDRLAPWIAALAAESDRGLASDLEGSTLSVSVEGGWAKGGAFQVVTSDGERVALLLEVSPGVYRGGLPDGVSSEEALFAETEGGARRPLRLPARPPPEHRGAGIDESMLAALAEAGGGRRLAAGERPPTALARSSVRLAPWLLLAAVALFVVERATALRATKRAGLARPVHERRERSQ